jgi:hypothetical protein
MNLNGSVERGQSSPEIHCVTRSARRHNEQLLPRRNNFRHSYSMSRPRARIAVNVKLVGGHHARGEGRVA